MSGPIIDWRLAGQVARGVATLAPSGSTTPYAAPAAEIVESERLVSAYTGLVATAPIPVGESVDRAGWIEANLTSMEGVLEPAAEKVGGKLGGFGATAAGALLAVEAGAISGFLAGRVLGQYDFPILDPAAPARLLLVAPNLGHAADGLEADHGQLLTWVALHETTHALQFGGVPWLRPYLADMVRELLDALRIDARRLGGMPDVTQLRALLDRVREDGVVSVAVGPERAELLSRLQCFMAVLEGYAEHVMDAVGVTVIPDLERLRSAMGRRRQDRSGLLRLFERLIGMDLKLRQYEQGKQFCDGVVALGGIAALNRVWDAPEALPTPTELDDPLAWLARTEPLAPAA